MLPVTVDERAGEERVVAGGHPVDQCRPRIDVGGEFGRLATEDRRLVGGLGAGRLRRAAVVEDLVFARLGPLLPADPREERGELVVVGGAPLLERVVVAAGALEAQAQEELREILDLLVGVDHLPVPDRGRVAAGLAGGGDDVADELVVGLVLRQARADPLVEGIAAVAVEGVVGPLVPQDRRPLECLAESRQLSPRHPTRCNVAVPDVPYSANADASDMLA